MANKKAVNYFKVVTKDLKSVGLLRAPPIQYKIGEWVYPLEPLSDHPRKGGGLWVHKRRSAALGSSSGKKYIEEKREIPCRVFVCRIGILLYESSGRVKTDKVMLLEELM